jgi:hypothetical protein
MAFAGPAVAAGARAVFGFPLQIGSIRLGALNLYRDAPGPLTDDQFADALVVSSVIARAVLEFEAHTPPGSIPREMEAGSDFRFVVHQASGMASVQLQIGVAEALIRLRAYAFAHERPLNDVAEDVVARRLRIE